MDEQFDTDDFISEIQNYFCIWDYKCESYSNKLEKNSAWANICQKFTNNFSEKSVKEKNDIGKALQRKWKALRDGFDREVKKNKSTASGSAASSKRQYVFFHQLSFLLPLAEARANTSNSLVDTPTENNEEKDNREPSNIQPQKLKRKSLQSSEDNLIATLSQRLDKKINHNEESDDDRYFPLSLHKDFKNISEELKLDAKTEMIGVLKKFKGMSSTPVSYFNNMPEHMIRNPYNQHINQPCIPSTSGQFHRYNYETFPPVSTPLASPQDSILSMESAHTNSSFEDVFQ